MHPLSCGSLGLRVAFLLALATVAGCAADAGDSDKPDGSGGNTAGSSTGSASGAGMSGDYGPGTGASSGTSAGSSSGASSGTAGGSGTPGAAAGSAGSAGTSGSSGASGASGGAGTAGTTSGSAGTTSGTSGSAASGADSGPAIVLTPSSLEVLFAVMSGNATNHAEFELDVVNHASTAIALSDVTLRYWFTADGNTLSTIYFQTYYSANVSTNTMINADVSGTFASAPAANVSATSDSYMELSFSAAAGSLPTNGKATVQCSWDGPGPNVYMDMFDEANDYSFDANDTAAPVQAPYVTAYVGGVLVWGIEPGIPPVVDASAGDAAEAGGEIAADGGFDATLDDAGSQTPDAASGDAAVDASVADAGAVTSADAGAFDAATE